jgi:hypothetical protein
MSISKSTGMTTERNDPAQSSQQPPILINSHTNQQFLIHLECHITFDNNLSLPNFRSKILHKQALLTDSQTQTECHTFFATSDQSHRKQYRTSIKATRNYSLRRSPALEEKTHQRNRIRPSQEEHCKNRPNKKAPHISDLRSTFNSITSSCSTSALLSFSEFAELSHCIDVALRVLASQSACTTYLRFSEFTNYSSKLSHCITAVLRALALPSCSLFPPEYHIQQSTHADSNNQ